MSDLDQRLRDLLNDRAAQAGPHPPLPPDLQEVSALPWWRRRPQWVLVAAAVTVTAVVVIPLALVDTGSTTDPMTAAQAGTWIDEICATRPSEASPSNQAVLDMDVVGAGICQWRNPALLDPTVTIIATQGLGVQQTNELMWFLRNAEHGTPDCPLSHDPRDAGYFVMLQDTAGRTWQVTVPDTAECGGFTLNGEPYWTSGFVDWLNGIRPPVVAPKTATKSLVDTLECPPHFLTGAAIYDGSGTGGAATPEEALTEILRIDFRKEGWTNEDFQTLTYSTSEITTGIKENPGGWTALIRITQGSDDTWIVGETATCQQRSE